MGRSCRERGAPTQPEAGWLRRLQPFCRIPRLGPLSGALIFILTLLSIFFAPDLCGQTLFAVDFEKEEVGKFPAGWSSRDRENMGGVYSVRIEEGRRFLHADARGISVPIGHERAWNLGEFPFLRWRWRALVFPEGSDERKKSGNDSPLSVYVLLGGWPIPRSVKYTWSDTLPAGTVFDSPLSGKTKIIVLRSGRSMAGKWVPEERNVLADYRRLFGGGEKILPPGEFLF